VKELSIGWFSGTCWCPRKHMLIMNMVKLLVKERCVALGVRARMIAVEVVTILF